MIKKMEKEDEELDASANEPADAEVTSETKNEKQSTYGINAVISYMIKSKSKENIPSNKQLYHSSKCLKYPEEIEIQYKNEINKKELSRLTALSYPTIFKYLKIIDNKN